MTGYVTRMTLHQPNLVLIEVVVGLVPVWLWLVLVKFWNVVIVESDHWVLLALVLLLVHVAVVVLL